MKLMHGQSYDIIFSERDTYTSVRAGSYAKIAKFSKNTIVCHDWVSCREDFLTTSRGLTYFLFKHFHKRRSNICAFMERVENILRIESKSIIGPTNRDDVSWIRISPWWSRVHIKRSLYTALLRAGQKFHPEKKNFYRALFSVDYLAETDMAVLHFLGGNTRYTGKKQGWYRQFANKLGGIYLGAPPDYNKIKELLIQPN